MPTKQLPVSSRPDFTALPSDPCVPLTPAQEAALWGGDVRAMLIGVLRAASRDEAFMRRLATQPIHATPPSTRARERV